MLLRCLVRTGWLAALAATCTACAGAAHTTSGRASATATTRVASPATAPSTTTAPPTTTGPALPGTGRPPVTIGDKNYTEQFVLGQLYLQALTAQGFKIAINQNIGPTEVTEEALKTGSLAMYPEYLGVFNAAIAGDRRRFRSQADAYRAAGRYALPHGLALLAPTPFADTDAIAVTVGYAAANRLRTVFDLRRVAATMTMAGPAQLKTLSPGLPALSDIYGVTPLVYRGLPVGAQYAALDGGSVQAAYVQSTDGQLASGDYRLLADPRRAFGWGNVVPVVSVKALDAEGPAFAATIERVDRTLTTAVMRRLNWAVDVAQEDPAAVAKQYLETHGLLAPLPG